MKVKVVGVTNADADAEDAAAAAMKTNAVNEAYTDDIINDAMDCLYPNDTPRTGFKAGREDGMMYE